MDVSRLVVSAAFAALTAVAAPTDALAQDAAAQQLFDEAMVLLEGGNWEAACPKLAESQRIDPGPGTLFHLSECHEREGRTATAWAGFLEVAGAARAAGRSAHESLARQRAKALEPRLTRLRVQLDDTRRDDLVIERDGVVVGKASLATDVPVDPGLHVIRARAPGAAEWQAEVDVRGEGRTVVVRVPALVGVADAPVTKDDSPTSKASTSRTLAIIAGAAGVVAGGIGGYLGLRAISLDDESRAHCVGNACNATGVDLRDRAIDSGHASTIFFAASGALVVAGVVLWLTAPSMRVAASAMVRREVRF